MKGQEGSAGLQRALLAPLEVLYSTKFGSKPHIMVQLPNVYKVGITDPVFVKRDNGQPYNILDTKNALSSLIEAAEWTELCSDVLMSAHAPRRSCKATTPGFPSDYALYYKPGQL